VKWIPIYRYIDVLDSAGTLRQDGDWRSDASRALLLRLAGYRSGINEIAARQKFHVRNDRRTGDRIIVGTFPPRQRDANVPAPLLPGGECLS
jgi:hypothetical protein